MTRGKRIDFEAFCSMVKEKKTAEEITKALSIKSSATLKNLQRRMMIKTGKVWSISGLDRRMVRQIKVRKNGMLIGMTPLTNHGINIGDVFDITWDGDNIILSRS